LAAPSPTDLSFRPQNPMALNSRLNGTAVPAVPAESSLQSSLQEPRVASTLNSEASPSVLGDFPLGHESDHLLGAMQAAINSMTKEDITVFGPNFEVQAIEESLLPRGNSVDIKSYRIAFKEEYGSSLEVDVKLFPSGSPPSGETIRIYDAREMQWVALSKWLRNFVGNFTEKSSLVRYTPYSVQSAWWECTGKTFAFLALPSELRNKVYMHVFGKELYPMSTVPLTQMGVPAARQNALLTMGAGYSRELLLKLENALYISDILTPEARTPVHRPNIALLQVSKQVSQEASHYAWMQTRKCFLGWKLLIACLDAQPGPATKFIYCPQSPDIYGHLSKVELNLNNNQFFEFFGVGGGTGSIRFYSARSYGHILQTIPGLRELYLHFRSPDDGWDGSPWGPWKLRLTRYGGEKYICCQRTTVDWICTFAQPFVANQLFSVSLTGAIKKDTKDKWEAIYKGDQAHDQDAALAAILNTPEALL
jgi:hypothetical protein